jgi:hypothetical protein
VRDGFWIGPELRAISEAIAVAPLLSDCPPSPESSACHALPGASPAVSGTESVIFSTEPRLLYIVMHKSGTSDTRNGLTSATNDIGLITLPNGSRLAIAVFITDSTADEATRDAVIARIAKAAYDESIQAKR